MHCLFSDFWYEPSKTYGELGPGHGAEVFVGARARGRACVVGGGWSRSNHCSRYSTDTEPCPRVVLRASTPKPIGFSYQFFEYSVRAACDVDTYRTI
jgi:hypothetical protein